MIEARLDGQDAVFETLKTLDGQLARQSLLRLADALYRNAQDGANQHSKSGALAGSLRLQAAEQGYLIFHDPQRAPYAPFVHWGAKPHVIRPKAQKTLRWPSGNGAVFAKFVNHPGYPGDDYLARAAADAPALLATIINHMRL